MARGLIFVIAVLLSVPAQARLHDVVMVRISPPDWIVGIDPDQSPRRISQRKSTLRLPKKIQDRVPSEPLEIVPEELRR